MERLGVQPHLVPKDVAIVHYVHVSPVAGGEDEGYWKRVEPDWILVCQNLLNLLDGSNPLCRIKRGPGLVDRRIHLGIRKACEVLGTALRPERIGERWFGIVEPS